MVALHGWSLCALGCVIIIWARMEELLDSASRRTIFAKGTTKDVKSKDISVESKEYLRALLCVSKYY